MTARSPWGPALGLALVILTGCGDGSGLGRSADIRGLVVGAAADVSATGAFQSRLGVYPLNVNVAETLVRLTPDYRVEPLLATRWQYMGQNTWRFFLRRGLRFHDGQAFTARAVQWSISQHVKGRFGYGALAEDSVKIVDDYTVDMTPTTPNLRLPEQLVHPNYSIFAPDTDPGVKPIGTGAFRFIEYRPNERIVVARNDAYWGEKARFDRITFRFFPDPTTRVLALLAGEVDLTMDFPREQAVAVANRSDLTVARAAVGQVLNLHVNHHGHEPYRLLRDRILRRAIALSIDRLRLVRDVWKGEGETVQNMTVPAILGPFSSRVSGFPFALRQAAQLLDTAGWRAGADGIREKRGRRLQLVMLANPEIDAGTVEFLQAQPRQTGMEIHWVRLPDIGSYAARVNAGEFDLNLSLSNQNDANPLFLPALIFYSKSGRPFARWHHVSDRYDRLVEAGLQATDPAQVQRLAAEAMHVAIDEEAVDIPVAGVFRLYAMKKTVEGFVPHPSQTNQSWTRVGLKRGGEQ